MILIVGTNNKVKHKYLEYEVRHTMLMSWRSFMPLALRRICAKVSNSLGSTSHFMSRPMLRSFGLELMRRRAEICRK